MFAGDSNISRIARQTGSDLLAVLVKRCPIISTRVGCESILPPWRPCDARHNLRWRLPQPPRPLIRTSNRRCRTRWWKANLQARSAPRWWEGGTAAHPPRMPFRRFRNAPSRWTTYRIPSPAIRLPRRWRPCRLPISNHSRPCSRELDPQAHFVSYPAPNFIAFRPGSVSRTFAQGHAQRGCGRITLPAGGHGV